MRSEASRTAGQHGGPGDRKLNLNMWTIEAEMCLDTERES